jgi:hypothetical protein
LNWRLTPQFWELDIISVREMAIWREAFYLINNNDMWTTGDRCKIIIFYACACSWFRWKGPGLLTLARLMGVTLPTG